MRNVAELAAALSEPSPGLVEDFRQLSGDLVVLGAAGKLGPSLVELACRARTAAGSDLTIHAVSRFSDPAEADRLQAVGAQVIKADIADDDQLAALPEAESVVFLVGAKFGTQGREHATWATNTYLPGRVAQRYRHAAVAALSTGNVYPMVSPTSGGSVETDQLAPIGEYAMSCVGRERILTHFSELNGTRLALIRLNYAVEMRYGVLVDLGRQILAGNPVDLTTGYANVIWQGYANEVTLRSLRHAAQPPFILNLTGLETLEIRPLAEKIADALGRPVTFTGEPAETALLSNATRCHELFGGPQLSVDQLIDYTAQWLLAEQPLLGKPTHFQSRDGQF